MKKMWKFRKDSRAVSPVIATILMVAITVVLAAVLYVMVSGYGGGDTQTPTGSFTMADNKGGGTYWLKLGPMTPTTNWDACKLSMTDGSSTVLSSSLEASTEQNITALSLLITPIDLAGDDKISSGDYILLELTDEGSYTFTLIFTETGGSIDSIDVSY